MSRKRIKAIGCGGSASPPPPPPPPPPPAPDIIEVPEAPVLNDGLKAKSQDKKRRGRSALRIKRSSGTQVNSSSAGLSVPNS